MDIDPGLIEDRTKWEYSDLTKTQLRVILKLYKNNNIRILVPMVITSEDIKQIRDLLKTAADDIGVTELPPLGAMVETAAAAMCIKEIVEYADFLSIGTIGVVPLLYCNRWYKRQAMRQVHNFTFDTFAVDIN